MYKKLLTTCLSLLLMMGMGCSQKEQPETQEEPIKEFIESDEVNKASLFVEVDIQALSKSNQGDSFLITLSDGTEYTLQINRIEETMPGVISIAANVNDGETGQSNLILQNEKLNGRIQMFKEGMTYQLGFEDHTNKHFIAPLDPEEKDVLQGSEPLEVPKTDG